MERLPVITYTISLDTINKVKDFVNMISRFQSEIDLTSGRYIVDAKSMMGIFSLDLEKPLQISVYDDGEIEELEKALAPFITK